MILSDIPRRYSSAHVAREFAARLEELYAPLCRVSVVVDTLRGTITITRADGSATVTNIKIG